MKKKVRYTEGTCFSVPLRSGGYACGVVARMDGKGCVFGYFFGPKHEQGPSFDIDSLHVSDAIFSGMFGDLGLLKEEWSILGEIKSWSRVDWPMPAFLRMQSEDATGLLCTYDEDSLKCIEEREVQVSKENIASFPEDGLMGYGYVERKLTKILSM